MDKQSGNGNTSNQAAPLPEPKEPWYTHYAVLASLVAVAAVVALVASVYYTVYPSNWLETKLASKFDSQPLTAENHAYDRAISMIGTPKDHKGFDQKHWCVCQAAKLPDGSYQIGLGDKGCKSDPQLLTIYPDHQYRSCWQKLTVGKCDVKLGIPTISSDMFRSYTRATPHLREPGSYLTPCEGQEPDEAQVTFNGAMLDVPELLTIDTPPEVDPDPQADPDPLPVLMAEAQQ